MPYKKGSLKGQLTTAEIRKLISAHNKLSKITIPPRSTRDTIMKIISKAGFRVNHGEQKLEQTKATKKDISLEKAKETTKRIPKTEEQKKKATERKQEKQVQKEKELKLAKKEGVKEFKKKKAEAQKKKPEPKKKTTMGTQTDEKPKPKPKPNKIPKSLKEDIEDSPELEETGLGTSMNMGKARCKLFIYVSKKIIQADKDNFKKVRIFTDNEMPNDLSNFGGSLKFGLRFKPSPLLRLYDFILQIDRWKDTMKRIRQECGVQEAIFVETAYDILYRRYDEIKEAILKQNKKVDKKELEDFIKKPKKIDYLFFNVDKKKVGRPVGSKTILNFSKFKSSDLKELLKMMVTEEGLKFMKTDIQSIRRFLKRLVEGDDFTLKKEIPGKERFKLPNTSAEKQFYRYSYLKDPSIPYSGSIYKVASPSLAGKNKKYFIDIIEKFISSKKPK